MEKLLRELGRLQDQRVRTKLEEVDLRLPGKTVELINPGTVIFIFGNMLIGLTQQTTISCDRPLYSTTTVR